ncbi:hypothetical protein AK830_g11460 [Neonectria ditissima]|uniref:Leucine-rich repeat domain-containing protein n=1 Tax=Neonectria ditissima TaxID=78410 RepID=A0A0P7B395_9HYPO|nr:hypothetical protein AK830_g11460 [Neonectria ditissima]
MASTTQSPPASLLGLTPELQADILRLLMPSSVNPLQNVLLVCKQLHEVALPLSVHTFRNVQVGNVFEPLMIPSRRLKFLRYVTITKPSLARHVKRLIFDDFTTRALDDLETTLPQYTDKDLETYKKLVRRTTDDENWRREWLHDFSESIGDAELAMILVACPNVQQLLFGEPYKPVHVLRVIEVAKQRHRDVLRQINITERTMPLTNLKEVYHESTDEKDGYIYWSEFATAFQLPSLRSYECIKAHGSNSSAAHFKRIPRRSSNVDTIYLRRSCITRKVARGILGACKALRRFEYSRGLEWLCEDELMPADLLDALLPHANTLEYLHVNFDDDAAKTGWGSAPDRVFMGVGLRQMTALRHLVVGMQALTGLLDHLPEDPWDEVMSLEVEDAPRLVQCLPRGLEHLEIHGCGNAIQPQAQELLALIEQGEEFPNLRRVRFLFVGENIEQSDVYLSCTLPRVRLEIVYQEKPNRRYDLIERSWGECGLIESICTRIYSFGSRERWLKYRGSNQGWATAERGVFFEPGGVPPHAWEEMP